MLTWDSRGFGQSGGTVTVDYKDNEGRDVQALIDWLAKQPEAQLDAAGRPARRHARRAPTRAASSSSPPRIDKRIDAIAPDIAWHSLLTALYRRRRSRAAGRSRSTAPACRPPACEGIVSPAGVQTGSLDPHITSAFVIRASTGQALSAEDRAWFDSRGPGALVDRIRVPTLLIQGTADTLFTLNEAITQRRRSCAGTASRRR